MEIPPNKLPKLVVFGGKFGGQTFVGSPKKSDAVEQKTYNKIIVLIDFLKKRYAV